MVKFLLSTAFLFAMFVMRGGAYSMWMSKDNVFIRGWRLFEAWCLLEEIRYFYKTLFIMFDITFDFHNVKQLMDNSSQPYRSIPNVF